MLMTHYAQPIARSVCHSVHAHAHDDSHAPRSIHSLRLSLVSLSLCVFLLLLLLHDRSGGLDRAGVREHGRSDTGRGYRRALRLPHAHVGHARGHRHPQRGKRRAVTCDRNVAVCCAAGVMPCYSIACHLECVWCEPSACTAMTVSAVAGLSVFGALRLRVHVLYVCG